MQERCFWRVFLLSIVTSAPGAYVCLVPPPREPVSDLPESEPDDSEESEAEVETPTDEEEDAAEEEETSGDEAEEPVGA